MSSEEPSSIPASTSDLSPTQELVVRSEVPAGLKYGAYREYVRDDFFYSCAYCTLSEFEAQGIRFTIDHYEPKSSRPDLEHNYDNLMYACNECNVLKGDIVPPEAAREDGVRFFRPDEDVRSDHFTSNGQRVDHLTEVGHFSIEMLELNRLSLRRLRDIRRRLDECDERVVNGIMSLRRFRIDQLPQSIKGRAVRAIKDVGDVAEVMVTAIDDVLKASSRSPLLDNDAEAEDRRQARSQKLSKAEGLYPGKWRGRKSRRSA